MIARKSSVTIYEVAKASGKSFPTVSRALNNNPRISLKTRLLVKEVADKLGYHPSFAGRCLSRGHTMMLRCVMADLYNPFNAACVSELQRAAKQRGYGILVSVYNYDLEMQRSQYEQVLGRDCDGVIGQVTDFAELPDTFRSMQEAGIPAVIIGDTPNADQVAVGIVETAKFLPQVEYLASLGHREIVYLVAGHSEHVTDYVTELFRQRMKEAGLPFDPARNLCIDKTPRASMPEAGYLCGLRLRREFPKATAVVVVNDAVACGVLRALEEDGFPVPEQLSVIGQDNIWSGKYSKPSLTTFDLDIPAMANAAVDLLLDPEILHSTKRVKVPGRFIARESVRRLLP